MTRALVIGGTGFVGLNLVDELLASGVQVRCTRRARSITVFLRQRRVECVTVGGGGGSGGGSVDGADDGALREAMQGCDVVYYTAAPYPRYSTQRRRELAVAAAATAQVVRVARAAGVRRLVATGSTGLLGPAPAGRAADTREIPRTAPLESVYRGSKWATHAELQRGRAQGLQVSTVLAGGCVGAWDARAGTGGMLVAAVSGRLPWYTDGLVHLLHVRDVARAHLLAAAPAVEPTDYCVPGHAIMLGDALRLIVTRYGGRMPAEQLGPEAARRRADAQEARAEPMRQRVPFPREMVDMVCAGQPIEGDPLLAALGLRLAPLGDALDDAHAWFKRFGYLRGAPMPLLESNT